MKRLLDPARKAIQKTQGKFVIEPDKIQDHAFSSPDSEDLEDKKTDRV